MPELNTELADFLRRARASCTAPGAGLVPDGRIRRVPGLKREEVALLAGVSTDYYTRLEQGRRITPSPAVLDAVARALGLDAAGHSHLVQLVGASTARRGTAAPPAQRVRPGMRQFIDSLDGQPALVLGRRTDVLAANRMACALFADFPAMRPAQRNYARWMLLSERARALFLDWHAQARSVVQGLRLGAGNGAHDPGLVRLVGELSAGSPDFGVWWAEHRVHQRTSGTKRLRHPVVGPLSVDYETFTAPGDADQTVFVYTTPPGSASREAMNLLANWSQPAAAAALRN